MGRGKSVGVVREVTLTALDPTAVPYGTPTTVRVLGTGFEPGDVVRLGANVVDTAFVSTTELTFEVTMLTDGAVATSVAKHEGGTTPSLTLDVIPLVTVLQGWTIDTVKAFILAHPGQLSEVLAAETAGQARTTLIAWLQELLDEE